MEISHCSANGGFNGKDDEGVIAVWPDEQYFPVLIERPRKRPLLNKLVTSQCVPMALPLAQTPRPKISKLDVQPVEAVALPKFFDKPKIGKLVL